MDKKPFPEKLALLLFQPSRYKVVYGGRGGAKSWGFARALLLLGISKKLRILCSREIQRSIKDSVHKLLQDQIQILEIGHKYQVLDQEIRGSNGTEFIFSGLATHTVESIKSFEGCDIVWIEEGQFISKRSWDILIPTIRKDGSEIWISFNPELETDPTYVRFVLEPPPNAVVVKMNWRDNPWFNKVLNNERVYCKQFDPKSYPNIWEGECKPAVEGAIYYDEIQSAQREHRIRNVPYDPMLLVHVIIDLGFGDSMAVSCVQKQASEIRVIKYIEDDHKDLSFYSQELKDCKYNWGKVWLPFADGFSRGSGGQKSADKIMRELGWSIAKKHEVSNLGVEQGIKVVRMTFPRIYFDRVNTERLIECCKRYRRRINRETLTSGTPLHDEFSHGADNLRYICTNIDSMTNENARRSMPYVASYTPLDEAVGY